MTRQQVSDRVWTILGEGEYPNGDFFTGSTAVDDNEQIKIIEYDGSEGYELRSDDDGWY